MADHWWVRLKFWWHDRCHGVEMIPAVRPDGSKDYRDITYRCLCGAILTRRRY